MTEPEFSYVGAGWPKGQGSGWGHPSILEAQKKKWPKFVNPLSTNLPLGISHEIFDGGNEDVDAHNTIMSYAYALARACFNRFDVSLLDFGCGIGHYRALTAALYPDLNVTYTGVDYEDLIREARHLFPDGAYYPHDDENWTEFSYNLVLASGSILYSEDWQGCVEKLALCTDEYAYFARLYVVDGPSYVHVQKPYRHGYQTDLYGWCVNRGEFEDLLMQLGLDVEREFVLERERICIPGAPEEPTVRGFLLVRS